MQGTCRQARLLFPTGEQIVNASRWRPVMEQRLQAAPDRVEIFSPVLVFTFLSAVQRCTADGGILVFILAKAGGAIDLAAEQHLAAIAMGDQLYFGATMESH